MAGAAVCTGGAPAAGTAPTAADPGWYCGPRRGAASRRPEQVCVDFSPDLPDEPRRWICHYETEPELVRVCVEQADAALLGDACDAGRPCVDGAWCIADHCLPPPPQPSCWLDTDCPGSACRFGSCREEAR
jgi:hypothetical protein